MRDVLGPAVINTRTLSNNCLGTVGGRASAETLQVNTTLTSLKLLNLRNNNLGDGGGRAISETLRVSATLTELNLGVNGLGEGGGRALADDDVFYLS